MEENKCYTEKRKCWCKFFRKQKNHETSASSSNKGKETAKEEVYQVINSKILKQISNTENPESGIQSMSSNKTKGVMKHDGNPQRSVQGPSQSIEPEIIERKVAPAPVQAAVTPRDARPNEFLQDTFRNIQTFFRENLPEVLRHIERAYREFKVFMEDLKREPLFVSSLFIFLCYYLLYFIMYCGFFYECPCRRCKRC